jgi:hypothetical protein
VGNAEFECPKLEGGEDGAKINKKLADHLNDRLFGTRMFDLNFS